MNIKYAQQGGGSTARLGGQELTLLCSFHQYRIEIIVDSCTLICIIA